MRISEKLLRGMAACAVAAAVGLVPAGCSNPAEGAAKDAASESGTRVVPVVLTPVAARTFENRLAVQGAVETKTAVVVAPKIPGTLDAVFVDEGDAVVAGETKLFVIDALNLGKAAEISRQDVAVAKCAQREAAANLEMLQAQWDKASIDFLRFQRLFNQNAVTKDVFEQQESRYKQTKAGLKHAETVVDLAAEKARQADAALAISEKNLADSVTIAPLTGKVSHRMKEPGESADGSHPVLRLVDPNLLEVSAFLPAQFYAQVRQGESKMRIQVGGVDAGARVVSYRSPTITPELRTFEVKCLIENPPDGVAPGALAEVSLLLESKSGIGCPSNAVLVRGDQKIVFVIENNHAKQVTVEAGMESDGWIEVRGDGIAEGTPVVTMGQYLLNEGTPVTVHEEGA